MAWLRGLLWTRLILASGGLAISQRTADEKMYRANEAQLHHDLMANYTSYTRPVVKHTDQLTVQYGLTLMSIDNLDQETQVLTTHAWARTIWKDYQLTWDPKDYHNITETIFPVQHIWRPDIHLYNGVGDGMHVDREAQPVVRYDGTILLFPPVTLRSRCELDYSHFPYDIQTCSLVFASWVYHGAEINIQLESGELALDTSEYTPSTEYDLVEHSSSRNVFKYDCCNETYPDVTFSLTLRRRVTFGSYLFIFPPIFTSLLLPVVFVLPPGSQDKITLGVGILIGHVLLVGEMNGFVSHAHPSMPKIALSLAINVVLVCFSLVIAAFVNNALGHSERKTRVPRILRKIFLGPFGRLLRCPYDDFTSHEDRCRHTTTLEFIDATSSRSDRAQIIEVDQHAAMTAEWRQLATVLDRLSLVIFAVIVLIVAIPFAPSVH